MDELPTPPGSGGGSSDGAAAGASDRSLRERLAALSRKQTDGDALEERYRALRGLSRTKPTAAELDRQAEDLAARLRLLQGLNATPASAKELEEQEHDLSKRLQALRGGQGAGGAIDAELQDDILVHEMLGEVNGGALTTGDVLLSGALAAEAGAPGEPGAHEDPRALARSAKAEFGSATGEARGGPGADDVSYDEVEMLLRAAAEDAAAEGAAGAPAAGSPEGGAAPSRARDPAGDVRVPDTGYRRPDEIDPDDVDALIAQVMRGV